MSLHLTLESGNGKEVAEVPSLDALRLVAVFENRGKKPLSVVIDATPLSHGRYAMEFADDRGQAVHPQTFGMCGTMSPLQEHEIALVETGGSFRTPVHAGRGTLDPGSYRARVRYEAYKSDRHQESLAPVVLQRLKHLWTGRLQSNWVSLTLK